MPTDPKKLGGAGSNWDEPDLPIPPGLQPGNQPSETVIPRVLDAVKEHIPSVPGVIKSALGDFGEGSQADIDTSTARQPRTLSTMGKAAKNALSAAKQTYTSKAGLLNAGKEIGEQGVETLTGMQPARYIQQAQGGDVAGAVTNLGLDAVQAELMRRAHAPGARLAGEHPAVGEQALAEHMQNGGSTFDPRTGRSLSGTNNWSVGVAPEHSVVSTQAPTPESYSQFVTQHAELLRRNPNLQVGTWYDDQTGLHHMDVVATTPNKSAAVQMGKQVGEKSIYHLGRGELVETTPQPERPLAPGYSVETYPWMGRDEYLVHDNKGNVITHSHPTEGAAIEAANQQIGFNQRPELTGDPESRAQALQQATPERKPFYGYHMANEKLDYIDGNRRGMVQPTGRPVGQEAARLNLKRDMGVGQDAPAGFYAYSAGTRPEPAISGRKYAHEVRGNFTMADVTDPQWDEAAKSAYDEALQKTGNATVAQYAATNAKEHAIREAGYDGYTAPGTGINFFYDGMPTKLVGAPVKEATAGKALHAEAGVARAGVARKGLGEGAPADSGQPATDVADPWANLQYDHKAIAQAQQESAAGQLPAGVSLVQRAQQLKEQLMREAPAAQKQEPQPATASFKEAGPGYYQVTTGPEETAKGHLFAREVENNPDAVRVASHWVAPDSRGQGIGSAQLETMAKELQGKGKQNLLSDKLMTDSAKGAWDKLAKKYPDAIKKTNGGYIFDLQKLNQTGASMPGEKASSVQNGDPLSLLTENERNQAMTKRLGNQFTQILRKLPAVADFEAAARKGATGRTWYQRSIDAFDAMRKLAPDYFKPEDADKFANVLAATSPQQGVPLNLREALTFWKEWHDAGRPTTISDIQKAMRGGDIRPLSNQPSKLPNVVRAINGEDMLPADKTKYYKVGNFGKNLTKSFGNVTLDSWMGNFAGVGEGDVAKPQFYHALALRTRQAAQNLGWHPAEAQAAIWTFTKTLAEMSGWKAAGGKYYRPAEMLDRLTPDKMKAYSNDFADIMKTDPEVRGKLSELGVDLNELDKRLKNVTPKPTGEALEGADKEALAGSLRRNAARIGRKQRQLEGFTKYTKPPAQSELELGAPDDADTSFPFGGPLATAIKSSSLRQVK